MGPRFGLRPLDPNVRVGSLADIKGRRSQCLLLYKKRTSALRRTDLSFGPVSDFNTATDERLDANEAGRKPLEERQHIATLQLLTDESIASRVDAVNLKDRLSDV